MAGNDVYSAQNNAPPTPPVGEPTPRTDLLVAQGAAGPGGLGVLADLGSTSDKYVVDGGQLVYRGADIAVRVWAQGAGNAGTGQLLDRGGNNTFSVEASIQGYDAPYDYRGINALDLSAVAQGAGSVGTGLLLSEGRDDNYLIQLLGEDQISQMNVAGQGYGGGGGTGVLFDVTGNDHYKANSLLSLTAEVEVRDRGKCEKGNVLCFTGPPLVSAWPCPEPCTATPQQSLFAQGAAFTGTGAMIDNGGTDQLIARSDNTVDVIIDDRRTDRSSEIKADVRSHQPAWQVSQGAAHYPTLGSLTLAGGSGDTLRSSANRHTAVSVTSSGVHPVVHNLYVAPSRMYFSQGSALTGIGRLAIKELGADIIADSTDTVDLPQAATHYNTISTWPLVQGAGSNGVMIANASLVTSSPSRPACGVPNVPNASAMRGYGWWRSCVPALSEDPASAAPHTIDGNDRLGFGHDNFMPGFAPKPYAPDIQLEMPESAVPEGAVYKPRLRGLPVKARVSAPLPPDPEETPEEGPREIGAASALPVHVTLQMGCTYQACLPLTDEVRASNNIQWMPMAQVDAVTDENGEIEVILPLLGTKQPVTEGYIDWRVAVTVDGSREALEYGTRPGAVWLGAWLGPSHAQRSFRFVQAGGSR